MNLLFYVVGIIVSVLAGIFLIDDIWESSLHFIPRAVISMAVVYAASDIIVDYVEKIKKHYRP
jgi:flagellar biosynthesis protein FliQ